jgi:hypothetical protein
VINANPVLSEEYMVLPLSARAAVRWEVLSDQKEKRPRLFSPGRLGSPPPELPNYEMDVRSAAQLCKRHFGNAVSRRLDAVNSSGLKPDILAQRLEALRHLN